MWNSFVVLLVFTETVRKDFVIFLSFLSYKHVWAPLNLAVLDQKLSQPLTLQTSCVISVRQLPSVSFELNPLCHVRKIFRISFSLNKQQYERIHVDV